MPLKVGIYSAHYPGVSGAGGIPTYTRSLAAGLTQLGHEVHVLTLGDDESTRHIDDVRLHFVRKKYFKGLERWIPGAREAWIVSARARELARRCCLDIFEFPNWEGRGAFFPFGRNVPPMAVRLHTSMRETLQIDDRRPTLGQRFECLLERSACMRATALYVSTRAHQRHMARELKIPETRMSVVPLGIPDVEPLEARTPRSRGTPPTILYLGRLERRKGTITLLNAIPAILQRFPDARIILAGKDRCQAPGGVRHEEYFKRVFPSALWRNVQFKGFTSDEELQQLFLKADVFVAPSVYESFGLIFIESMRWSVPVIGTNAGGIPEVVDDGTNGLIVPVGSAADLAGATIKVLSDEVLRLRLARAARETYERRFSHIVMASRTAAFYESIVQSRQRSVAEPRPAVAELAVCEREMRL
jgi:glycosyltransferase involved in cell wall biosynthesis